MAWAIPQSTVVSLKEGQNSIVVWSLQKALKASLVIDGDFGPKTKAAVVNYQKTNDLTADGKAGPVTQRSIVTRRINDSDSNIPSGLLEGFAESEGGWLLGAVNWSVPGGVDCGVFQRRVYSEDEDDNTVIQNAFDVVYQALAINSGVQNLRTIFGTRIGTRDGYGGLDANEKAWRLAILNHNYPAGADRLSRTPVKDLSSYWTTPQSWVTSIGVRFPDGVSVRTPLEWSHFYAGILGYVHKTTGSVAKFVTDWTA